MTAGCIVSICFWAVKQYIEDGYLSKKLGSWCLLPVHQAEGQALPSRLTIPCLEEDCKHLFQKSERFFRRAQDSNLQTVSGCPDSDRVLYHLSQHGMRSRQDLNLYTGVPVTPRFPSERLTS